MELTDHQHRCQAHIKAAEESGLSLSEYAKRHNLKVHSLYGERRRLRKQSLRRSPDFVQVQRLPEPVLPATMLQIRLPNGVSLAIPSHEVPLIEVLTTLARL